MKQKYRLFVDMDGTLAEFKPVDRMETLYEQGYFRSLAPLPNVVNAVRKILDHHKDVEVYILSAYLKDSSYALIEKNQWLDQHLPEITPVHRIFVPYGLNKYDYVPQYIKETDVLLDDYTHNLLLWQPFGRGIKLLNGINHTKGTWQNDCVHFHRPPDELAALIVGIVQGRLQIKDVNPTQNIEKENAPEIDQISKLLANEQSVFKLIDTRSERWACAASIESSNEEIQRLKKRVSSLSLRVFYRREYKMDLNSLDYWEKNKSKCTTRLLELDQSILYLEKQLKGNGLSKDHLSFDCKAELHEYAQKLVDKEISPKNFMQLDDLIKQYPESQIAPIVDTAIKEYMDSFVDVKSPTEKANFYGRIDYLGRNRDGETIIGETELYNCHTKFLATVEESLNCGRPISHFEISKEEYDTTLSPQDEALSCYQQEDELEL